ncbi:SDR family NAD(P)-dependent oxidoreductase [Paraburkholderia tropica]|uniref:SDR family NAD(P)-dependent oxidoreductase n=1 Tax=Paraburkholderia tropica TaxID=92647 RepID=UPI002AB79EF8|nr:SDR family oxidoreductase [Paraburkholderia tropica]
MSLNIENTRGVAYVTGGASGIGAEVCARLMADGYAIAAADANEAGLGQLVERLSASGRITTQVLDVRDPQAQRAFVERVELDLGPVTAVVPCAGLTRSGPAETMALDDWELVMDVNVTGTFVTCQAAAEKMLARGHGAIVCIGSIVAKGGQAGRSNYAASKFAIAGLVKSLAIEWGGRGLRVNAVSPGVVATPMVLNGVPEHFQDIMHDRIPMGRFATPADIAAAIAMLLSSDAGYVTGAIVEVDGGVTAGFLTANRGEDYATRHTVKRIEPDNLAR